MPRSKSPVSTLDQLAEQINTHVDTMAEGIAEHLGPASGTDRYTQKEIDDLWDTPDSGTNTQQLFEALQQGLTPEGAQAVALFKMAPDLLQHAVGTPLPADQAATIAKLAEYPGRYVLTAGHSGDAADQVKYVAEQHKRAAKRGQQVTETAAPEQTPAMSDYGGY
jgi:hypothetical protein